MPTLLKVLIELSVYYTISTDSQIQLLAEHSTYTVSYLLLKFPVVWCRNVPPPMIGLSVFLSCDVVLCAVSRAEVGEC